MGNLSKNLLGIAAMMTLFLMGHGWFMPSSVLAVTPPSLAFEFPTTLQPIAQRLQQVDPKHLLAIMDLAGLEQPGPPIHVILAPNESDLAKRVPEWVVGYAVGHTSLVVLLPDRVPNYPYDSLEGVLLHEIGHILTHRAAGGHALPRWFDEGLAMIADRTWNIEDRARLVWAMVSGHQMSLEDLTQAFVVDSSSARRAYIIAHALTLDLIERTSPDFPKRLLAKVRFGIPFQEAFAQTSLMTLDQAEAKFWNQQTLWNRWIPVATSSGMIWLMITALVFYAARKQRKRAAAIKKRWEDEDLDF
ncbi:hypothetical protein [Candidatus Nitronereus thalassa]|uniref:Peptidase MA-like domain-containing protein n=1 Tax=Candidatus Nitronereus thalassa TaxID=3020898 RepID=A0ABU3K3B7_9BACT|nr:hypothetical protein [Candidatus Nitronereus thalassa]MDT7040888.1 hypothetical protein [Candidatus Nitronereus thalassa]